MEGKESEHKDSNHGEPSESREKFMERMERRHRNAVAIFEIERILSPEEPVDEYPSTTTPEDIRKRREAEERLRPILDILSAAGLIGRIEYIKRAITLYLLQKVQAQRAELELMEKLKSEDRKTTPQEIGLELFRRRTGEDPKMSVEAMRYEGYFILTFFHDDDYFKFIGDYNIESFGRFHQVMTFPNLPLGISVVSVRHGWASDVFVHERQHFINLVVLDGFFGIEDTRTIQTSEFPLLTDSGFERVSRVRSGLKKVKDELLARIRDGSSSARAIDFFDLDLYRYLRDVFLDDEQREVQALLKKIGTELDLAFKVLPYAARGILVYHLIDAPLEFFSKRIKDVVDFYNAKIQEFTIFIPDNVLEERIIDQNKRKRLSDLRLEIIGIVYITTNLIMGIANIGYANMQERLRIIKDEIKRLRNDYDALCR